METNNKNEIDELNNLLEINNDRIEGYKYASKETNEMDLKNLFSQLAENSQKCKQELISEIKKLGGTPIEGTRVTGKLYRAWMDIRAAVSNKSRKAILKSCEFGEDIAIKNYEKAIKNIPSESTIYEIISKQYAAIRADHDKIKNLIDASISEMV
jgi:uncharacterized protein (TIGR02284 family)